MTDIFGDTTTTLTKMIPVAATVGILHGATRRRAAPKRRTVKRPKRAGAIKRVAIRRVVRKSPPRRKRRR